jgi:hypothetical protein
MKTSVLVGAAALAACLGLGGPAFADNAQKARPIVVAQDSSQQICDPKTDKAVPLALVVRTSGIVPAVDPGDYGTRAAMRGSCVGTAQFVPKSQQMFQKQPHVMSDWDLGSAFTEYKAGQSSPPNYHTF